ncbi:protein of unknown function DUF820 [[Leptolyngbya] sp. PCC 7376]|uniref:Uma2 family endonuclease n=1 Tax=[Leptolyngbya] sp. PCC 7376 TaxID=111781 RepID=UPI00029ED8B1|nr:Uma2 family endonuclease [[Leptolyngbya] sp. PCC 7376]AFY39934.1 protein of unknown function DUF820 [[Leptolyngbya] sp. PCC 7376]
MVVTTTVQKNLSLNDFLAMPETKPASEYIDGIITQKPMPKGKHSRIQSRLAREIDLFAEDKKIALALTELRCTFAERSLVPDIAVIRWENLPKDEDGEIADRFERHPDWTIEILSPDQSAIIVMEKIIFCLEQGTELGWLIDPQAKSISVFQPSGLPQIYSIERRPKESIMMVDGFEDWQLSITDIFDWLKI